MNSNSPRKHLSVVLLGPHQSGKSTIAGRLLYELGEINDELFATTSEAAKQMEKKSSHFAFLMDKGSDERACGMSINISYREFTTYSYHYTMIDAPGNRDFRTNLIRSIAQGDIALLVIPANKAGFECSIQKKDHKIGILKGETRVQSQLCHLMGIKQMIVCINQMDHESVNWNEDRFNEIKDKVGKILKKLGYKLKRIPFIPMSGLFGDNLTERTSHMSWYKGLTVKRHKQKVRGYTLLEALENVVRIPKHRVQIGIIRLMECYIRRINEELSKVVPKEIVNLCAMYLLGRRDRADPTPWVWCEGFKIVRITQRHSIANELGAALAVPKCSGGNAFRMPVSEVFKIKGVGNVVCGRVEQGLITKGMNVKFYPTGCTGVVASIQMQGQNGTSLGTAHSGDNVGLCIMNLPKENMPHRGDVMVIDGVKEDPKPPRAAKEFTALVFVQDHPFKLSCGKMERDKKTKEKVVKGGYTPSIHIGTAKAPCQMTAINWKMGKSTSNAKVEGVPYIEAGDQAEVVFAPKRRIVVQPFDECKSLGRFVVMDSNSLIMLGKVIKVLYSDK